MNQIVLIGHLTADPITRATSTGKTVTSFTIGVTRSRKDANGDKQSDFFRITTWGATADFCAKYLTKGSKVYVRGELQPIIYDGRDGKARLDLSVQADRVENLTEKPKETPKPNLDEFEDISSDDLPFGR